MRNSLFATRFARRSSLSQMLEAGFSGTSVQIVRGRGARGKGKKAKKTKNAMVWKCGACGKEKREVGDVRVKKEKEKEKEKEAQAASKRFAAALQTNKKKNYVHRKPRLGGNGGGAGKITKPRELGGDFVALSPQLGAKKKKKKKGEEKSGLMDFLSSLNK